MPAQTAEQQEQYDKLKKEVKSVFQLVELQVSVAFTQIRTARKFMLPNESRHTRATTSRPGATTTACLVCSPVQ